MGRRWRDTLEWFGFSPRPLTATFDSAPKPIDLLFAELYGRGSVSPVSRVEALSVPAVQRGRNLICSIATLPLVQHGPKREVVRNPLLEQIDPDVANVVTLAQTLEDLLFESVSWWRITGFGFDGFPMQARHLDHSSVSVDPPKDRSAAPLPSGLDPRNQNFVWVDGKPVSVEEIIRFDSPNPAVLTVGARAIRRALLLDKAASMYADDPRPQDYFTPADGADEIEDNEIETFLSKWKSARKRRSTAYVPASVNYNAVDSPSPADLQLVELQRQATIEIANALGVDPEELGVSTTSRTYANAVDRRRDRINDVLSPFMRAITDRLSMGDVTKRGYYVAFNLDDYMKSNPTERWSVYEKAKNMGVLTVDEIREEEGLPALPAGTDGTPAPVPAGPDPDPEAVVEAHQPAAMTFDDDGDRRNFDLPMVSFAANKSTRIIEGLAMPYGQVVSKYGMRFRFAKGALKWNKSAVSRVKLLRDHDPRQALGVAVKMTDGPSGLHVKFKVATGPEGDRALALAAEGVLDGLSAGMEWDMATDAQVDPNNDGVMLVRRADLREVSLTAMPAFDDARVTKVAASRDEGVPVPDVDEDTAAASTAADTTTPQDGLSLSQDQAALLLSRPGALQALMTPPAPATPVTPPGALTLSQEQLDALIRSGGLNSLLGLPQASAPARPEPAPERRQTVNPTRLTASVAVADPVSYRFDRQGQLRPGAHDFGLDMVQALRGGNAESEEYRRVMEFVRAQFDVISTDVNELNPTINVPRYIDQREFQYPIWTAVSKGTPPNGIQPFQWPKFNSAASLVGDHTEGTEPSSGTYTTTSQSVTPSAVSGKAKISRETWDMGGMPGLSDLIWRQILRSWFEALEAEIVSTLDAASPTALATFTAGGGTTGQTLVSQMRSALAKLHFVRGGFRFDTAFSQIDLYDELVGALDGNGRPLLPAIGPTNADGTVDGRYQSVNVNGVPFLPSWALAATGTGAASSYLIDRFAVDGWATAPQRLLIDQSEVANVYIGVWGYKATAINDLNGVREISYDPVA